MRGVVVRDPRVPIATRGLSATPRVTEEGNGVDGARGGVFGLGEQLRSNGRRRYPATRRGHK